MVNLHVAIATSSDSYFQPLRLSLWPRNLNHLILDACGAFNPIFTFLL